MRTRPARRSCTRSSNGDSKTAAPFDMGDLLVGGPIDHALVELVPLTATREVVKQLGMKLGRLARDLAPKPGLRSQ